MAMDAPDPALGEPGDPSPGILTPSLTVAEIMELFENPLHPYTKALLSAVPAVERKERIILEGTGPIPIGPPRGCRFHTRCFIKQGKICETEAPHLASVRDGHFVCCHLFS